MSTSGSSIPSEAKDDKSCECRVKPDVTPNVPRYNAEIVEPHNFQMERHYYPRIQNAKLHISLEEFLRLGNNRIAARYAQLHPGITKEDVLQVLTTPTKLFRWAGADLFNVMDKDNGRYMVVVETNSCPSGQKSMPMSTGQDDESNGYHVLMREVFAPWIREQTVAGALPRGGLAVVYDKNPMEALGYASALATVMEEPVYTVKHYNDDPDAPVRWEKDGCLHIRQRHANGNEEWLPIRAVFRYLTQKPWTRLPVNAKTLILNPIEACLAGGRNKLTAAHAYQRLNDTLPSGLRIRAPLTVMNVDKNDVGTWIDKMGGWVRTIISMFLLFLQIHQISHIASSSLLHRLWSRFPSATRARASGPSPTPPSATRSSRSPATAPTRSTLSRRSWASASGSRTSPRACSPSPSAPRPAASPSTPSGASARACRR
jgi:hypothetical protein